MTTRHRLKSRLGRIGVLAVFVGLLLSLPAHAATKAKVPPPVDRRILVTVVDVPNQQITIVYQDNKRKQVYVVDERTDVTVNGQKGTFKDIKVGQQVGDYVERDDKTLDSIAVGIADPPPVAPAKKK